MGACCCCLSCLPLVCEGGQHWECTPALCLTVAAMPLLALLALHAAAVVLAWDHTGRTRPLPAERWAMADASQLIKGLLVFGIGRPARLS